MDISNEIRPDLFTRDGSLDCLVNLVDAAEGAEGGVDDNLHLANALDEHVLLYAGDQGSELMCQRCPVMCTIKSVGGSAISLVSNKDACIK